MKNSKDKYTMTFKDPILMRNTTVVVYANSEQEAIEIADKKFHTLLTIEKNNERPDEEESNHSRY